MMLSLAFRNIRRQTSTYVIYFITVVFIVALMFAVNNVLFSEDLYEYAHGMEDVREGITRLITPFVVAVVCVVCFIVCYATSYLLRRRRREFGTYMLLGIGRSRVIGIFVLENFIVGLISFAAGCALGVAAFYALNAVVCAIMGGGMSPLVMHGTGIWVTAAEWAGISLIAMAWSAVMLMRAKLGDLIRDTDKARRMPRFPQTEVVVSVVMLCAIVGLSILMATVIYNALFVMEGTTTDVLFVCTAIGASFFALMAAIVIFHIGLRSLWLQFVMRRQKKPKRKTSAGGEAAPSEPVMPVSELYRDRAYKGTTLFRCRNMAGAMDRNAAIMGVVALLMTLAVLLSNFSFSLYGIFLADTERLFDVTGRWIVSDGGTGQHVHITTPEQAVEEAEKRTHVDRVIIYDVHAADVLSETEHETYVIAESDAALMLDIAGEPPVTLSDDCVCVFVSAGMGDMLPSDIDTVSLYGEEMTVDEVRYAGTEIMETLCDMPLPFGIVIAPDEVAEKGETYLRMLYMNCGYLSPEYDALFAEYGDTPGIVISPIDNRYNAVDKVNAEFSVILVTCLFLGITFMLMSMALLSLKVMSDVGTERRRYEILLMLGTDEKTCRRSLMSSLALLLGAPVVIPLLMTAPALVICTMISNFLLGHASVMLYVTGIAVPLVYLVIYGCYFAAAYHLSVTTILSPARPGMTLLRDGCKYGRDAEKR